MSQSFAFEVNGHFETTDVDMRGPIPNARTNPRFVDVELKITNRSKSQMSFTFLTTQRFDIELLDQTGTVVTRWSQGRVFGQIVLTEQLAPKSSWEFEGKLPLFDSNFNWIATGQYTIRIHVTANLRPSAESPLHFQIGLLP
jgi:hypothetical protein